MQDCLALQQELSEIVASQRYAEIAVVPSKEPWNPVAAVILRQVTLPRCVPSTIDLRIPIPNLYAFTNSVYVVITYELVSHLGQDGNTVPIPGYHKLEENCVNNHSKQFVDFREQVGWKSEMYTLFLTPEWDPEGFKHTTITQFLMRLIKFFESPREYTKKELEYCAGRWRQTSNPWWLIRSGQLFAEIGDFESAREILLEGHRLFPSRQEFRQLFDIIPS